MSSNEWWRSSKIVDRSSEIIGGIKNGLEKGQSIAAVKQSFINAGYSPTEVNSAEQKMGVTSFQQVRQAVPQQIKGQPINSKLKTTSPSQNPKQLPQAKTKILQPGEKKPLSKTLIISLIVGSALILIGAAVLGLLLG